jgi:hypothetical protein
VNTLTFNEVLLALLASTYMLRSEEPEPAPADDPTRDPNWCWTHQQIYPACAGQHEGQK